VERVLEVGNHLEVGEGGSAANEFAGERRVGEELDVARLRPRAGEQYPDEKLQIRAVDEAELHVGAHDEDPRAADGVEYLELGDLEAQEVHLLPVQTLGYLDEDDVVVDMSLDDAGRRIHLEAHAEDLREGREEPVNLYRLHHDPLDVVGDELEQAILVDLLGSEDDGNGGRIGIAILLLEDFLAGPAGEAVVQDHHVGERVAELDRAVQAVDRGLHVQPARGQPVLEVFAEQIGLVNYQYVL